MLGMLDRIDQKTRKIDRWLPATPVMVGPLWEPLPGPQSDAYLSLADEVYYGGAAGGGKTDLLLGLAVTMHRKSIIFRREYAQLKDILLRSEEILADVARFNAQANTWRGIPGDRLLEFGAVQYEKDKNKYKGRPHDFYGFDELPEFTEKQYRFLIGWARTTDPHQRVRVVNTGNPPTHAEGEWVIRYWGPWLDDQHPNPGQPGELRWFAVLDGESVEVESDAPFEHDGELIRPRSRTFIPARLEDNPYLADTDYRTVLQSLPEPLRSQLLYGDFTVGQEDDPWQVIPTEWVRLAQKRWKDKADVPMTALGVDVARGGDDQTVLAPRYGNWFGRLQKHPGSSTPDGPLVASLAVAAAKDGAVINVDVIGVGSSVYDTLASQGVNVVPVNFSERSEATDKSGRLRFRNKRAEAYWRMREALDPDYGDDVSLPPDDNELLADLVSPHWKLTTSGIQVESKEDIIKRLARSPDCGDAIVLANFAETPRWREIPFLKV